MDAETDPGPVVLKKGGKDTRRPFILLDREWLELWASNVGTDVGYPSIIRGKDWHWINTVREAYQLSDPCLGTDYPRTYQPQKTVEVTFP